MADQMALWDAPLPVSLNPGAVRARREREAAALDAALTRIEEARERLVGFGRLVAGELAAARGEVTAREVVEVMAACGNWAAELAIVDPRWTGALFQRAHFVRVGERPDGSHYRRVSVWKRRIDVG